MADIILKASTVDTQPSSTAVLIGAEGASVASPTLFSVAGVRGGYIAAYDYLTGNGSTDDTTAFSALLTAAAGKPILIPTGMVIRLTSAVSYTGDIVLFGGGQITFAHSGEGLRITGSFRADDITFYGSNTANHGVYILNGGSGRRLELNRCSFTNFWSGIECYAVRVETCDYARIIGCKFKTIGTIADNNYNDNVGVVRAIGLNATVSDAVIDGCTFDDINNYSAYGGIRQSGDSDCIAFYSAGQVHVHKVRVTNCTFSNCGKRFMKGAGGKGSIYVFSHNTLSSSWTNTTDTASAMDNGMFSCISHFGGHLRAENNVFDGGITSYFAEIAGANVESAVITGNTFSPEYHNYAWTNMTMFVVGAALPSTAHIVVSNNFSENTYTGVSALGGNVSLLNNDLSCNNVAVDPSTDGNYTIVGNKFTGPGTTNTYGIIVNAGIDSFVIVGNEWRSFQYGIYLNTQSAAYRGVVVGNTVSNCSGADISINVGATYLQYLTVAGNNTERGTEPLVLRGLATLGGAASTSYAGYLTTYVNGIAYKIPLYN